MLTRPLPPQFGPRLPRFDRVLWLQRLLPAIIDTARQLDAVRASRAGKSKRDLWIAFHSSDTADLLHRLVEAAQTAVHDFVFAETVGVHVPQGSSPVDILRGFSGSVLSQLAQVLDAMPKDVKTKHDNERDDLAAVLWQLSDYPLNATNALAQPTSTTQQIGRAHV